MNDIFSQETANFLKGRVEQLTETSQAKWSKMNVMQMLAHSSKSTNMAFGKLATKRMFLGRILGKLILKKITKDATPFGKNSPTAKELLVVDKAEFGKEKNNLINSILEIATKTESDLDGIVHPFFGKMTGKQWNVLVYKHLDHHLQQFGV